MDASLEDRIAACQNAADQDRLWAQVRGTLGDDFEAHWDAYQAIFAGRAEKDGPPVAWHPDEATVQAANLSWLMQETAAADVDALHHWSTRRRDAFWQATIDRIGVPFAVEPRAVLEGDDPEHPAWLPGARFNAASACFSGDPDETAIIAGGEGQDIRRITFAELKRLADEVSHGLVARGFQAGDAVALYLPMNVECVAAYLGIVQAGMVVISIPDSFAPDAVAMRLRLGDAKAVLTVDAFQRGGRSVPMYPKAREAAESMPERPTVFVIDAGETELAEPDFAWSDLLEENGPFAPVPCDPDDVTNILFSSGTTGEPKAIPWTHLTPIKSAGDGHWHQDIRRGDVVAWPTNIGWMMGPWLIYASLVNGAPMALYEGVPTSRGFVDFVNEAEITMLGVVPAIVRAWRTQEIARPGDLDSVRVFSSTGEASNAHDYLYLMSLADYRAPIIEYCGGTEIGGGHLTGTVLHDASPATFTTPAMGLDTVILDDEGDVVPEGGMGELYIVPPSIGLSQTLLNRDHHEEYYAGCPTGPHGEVLRRHGDEVQRLHNGFYAAQGRADDTMNIGGIKVGSIELERVMDEHPAVRETAAVGIPPPEGGADRLIVFAVPADRAASSGGGVDGDGDVGALDTDALRKEMQDLVKKHLNPLFRVHDVVAVDALPRTVSNKVMRRTLRSQYQELAAA